MFSSIRGKWFMERFMIHYNDGSISTIETGCLIFSSWMVYYLLFISLDPVDVFGRIVTVSFFIGALTFLCVSSFFNKISRSYESNTLLKYLKISNKYIFMVLSFLPGLYYAFKCEEFILKFYLVAYFISSGYFLYKRYREFELEPFIIGLMMSVVLFYTGPFIHSFFAIFGSGWFANSCAYFVESVVDLALAVAFILDLPRKYLPSNMLFGLKFVKFFVYFLSWQTWFILMVFATWKSVGAGAQVLFEIREKRFASENKKDD